MNSTSTSRWVTPAGILPVLIASVLFVYFAQMIPAISAGESLRLVWAWVPSLGVNVSFLVDGLSLTFALLITGIGALVMLYSARYLAGHEHQARFSLFLTSFMLAMLGVVLSDNLLGLFVFWELTTITSYLLIGFGHASPKSRRSALQALLVTGVGGLALLAAIIMIGNVAGTFELSEIRAMPGVLTESALYLPILILVLLGTFTKSAQIPFHFWLPNAMAAPTPVSAYLHSATMVKAGVYLMARMHPSLSGTEVWLWTLTIAGAVTMVFASVMALRQTDLKQALAYTTLMALGALTLLLGNDTAYTITAAATFLVVHSLYKAALFLVVGILDHQTGTRDANKLFGLAPSMPITATAAAIAALSMAGFPPFLGFIGKELKYAGAIAVASEPILVAGAILIASALMVAIAGIVSFRPFWSKSGEPLPNITEAPWPMLAGPLILALLGAIFGIFPDLMANTLVNPTVDAILAGAEEARPLQLWAGVNLPLMLSIATFVLGFTIYYYKIALRNWLIDLVNRSPSFDRGWDNLLAGLLAACKWQTRLIQTGVLRRYMFLTFATALAALAGTLWLRDVALPAINVPDVTAADWLVFLLVLLGTALTAATSSRIAAIAGLGVVGIGIAMIFILYSAPDVAITQLLVETLIVVLFAAAALRLPHLGAEPLRGRPWDALLAIGLGVATTAVLLVVTAGPIDLELTEFFQTASWPQAFGQNIVNVILVDFRALDTFGEIAVVLVAAISIYALLKSKPEKDQT
ncbi:putative monovalent cation/H+ antiporter subunit A [Cognatiyoonia sp. IB215182]|uniref:putative monovalent cation/H+ antiporter subunit A n=1 Tax=Cognatiyoonia sp. IB215182 TaxID=3097353 RepID=UPI002A0B173D|nr:putative monovalent cation/H+ antiporter subunit A [Cognatiyoonia sp. IB215182]MDX8352063.1 putative monovalent cation/H+ antiporter subunit A [Cognatiyoonia sp. IB215182]